MLIAEPLQTVINFLLRLGRLLMAALCRFSFHSLSPSRIHLPARPKRKKKMKIYLRLASTVLRARTINGHRPGAGFKV
jgi:hypothetical protein